MSYVSSPTQGSTLTCRVDHVWRRCRPGQPDQARPEPELSLTNEGQYNRRLSLISPEDLAHDPRHITAMSCYCSHGVQTAVVVPVTRLLVPLPSQLHVPAPRSARHSTHPSVEYYSYECAATTSTT